MIIITTNCWQSTVSMPNTGTVVPYGWLEKQRHCCYPSCLLPQHSAPLHCTKLLSWECYQPQPCTVQVRCKVTTTCEYLRCNPRVPALHPASRGGAPPEYWQCYLQVVAVQLVSATRCTREHNCQSWYSWAWLPVTVLVSTIASPALYLWRWWVRSCLSACSYM